MSRLLAHLHLYYADQADYFVSKLRNICGCDWNLVVTMVSRDEEAEAKIKAAFPEAEIRMVENRGYDVWPFIQLIQRTDLNEYDFVLKLHSKNANPGGDRLNGITYRDFELRDAMVDSYLLDGETFLRALRHMESKPRCGLYCNRAFYKSLSDGLPEDLGPLSRELERIGLKDAGRHFCAGSIFLARAACFRPLQTPLINSGCFAEESASHSIGSAAHVYERIISMTAPATGYRMDTFCRNARQWLYLNIAIGLLQPLGENIFALKRMGEKRVKTLVLFGLRIPLEKK